MKQLICDACIMIQSIFNYYTLYVLLKELFCILVTKSLKALLVLYLACYKTRYKPIQKRSFVTKNAMFSRIPCLVLAHFEFYL